MMNTTHTPTTHTQHMDDHLEPRQPAQLPSRDNHEPSDQCRPDRNPPIIFDGDRSKTDRFITQFDLLRIINDRNPVITNPKRRVALALTYIRGPKSRRLGLPTVQCLIDKGLW